MANYFLHLELDTFGIKAMIIESGYKNNSIKDQCLILFKDMPDPEENSDPFDTGMNIVAQQLDLKICSTAIIFVSQLSICFRNIELPFSSEKKIKQILPFELETRLPLINEAYISDFHLLDIKKELNFILSASIVESQVNKYFLKLGNFGIKPLVVTPGGYAAAINFIGENNSVSTFAFLHIADSEITLVLIINRKPFTVRTFSTSLYSPENFAICIKQTIIGFNQRTGTDTVFDIFVNFDGNNSEAERIYNSLEIKHKPGIISKINSSTLLIGISPDKKIKHLFNFCQGQYGTNSFVKKYLSNIAASIVLFLIVFSLFMMSCYFDQSKLNKKIAAIDSKALSIFMTTFPDQKKVLDPYLQMEANVRDAIKKSSNAGNKNQVIENKTIKTIEIMGELSKRIPSSIDMEASKFLFNNGRLFLTGSTDNFNNVNNIKSKIESSDLFKNVSISSAASNKKGTRVNFKFIIEM